MDSGIEWPNGHQFAFTFFDDTDWATIERVGPVYDLLLELGFYSTKSVWMFPSKTNSLNSGMTCEDPQYLEWVISLQKKGFEIAIHNAAPGTSPREVTHEAIERFRDLFGDRQFIHCNHVGCLENIYWGDQRLSGWRRQVYNLLTGGRYRGISKGHIEGDPLFWGDLCQSRVRYVRSFVFEELNCLTVCPYLPYHDPKKTYVNYWFISANGDKLEVFLKNFTKQKIDRLVQEGGLCITYVHFADQFASDGKVNEEFKLRMEYIASKGGWFAPVSEILDYVRKNKEPAEAVIPNNHLSRLEARWLVDKILHQLKSNHN